MDDLGAPISHLVLRPGAPVFDRDGKRVGVVEHVLYDAEVDVFDGIIVDTSPLPGGLRFADADQIDGIFERGVVLNVTREELHEPSENAPALEADPDDVMESPLQARLRRAWDWISGRY
jgi:uncharacterized protein YrrD